MAASLVVGGVFLLAMIVASAWAAVMLPADVRIPVHYGSVEHCYLAPKRAGLVVWPAVGAVVYGAFGAVAMSSLAAGWVPGVRAVLAPAALGVLLAFQVGALVLAGRPSAGASTLASTGQEPAGAASASNEPAARKKQRAG